MNKTEIKRELKFIIKTIEEYKKGISDLLEPIERVKSHLDEIQSIQEEFGFDTEIDFDSIESSMIESLLSDDEGFADISDLFECLLSNIEEWSDESSENKSQQIMDDYHYPIEGVFEGLVLDEVYDADSLDDMLEGVIQAIWECGIL